MIPEHEMWINSRTKQGSIEFYGRPHRSRRVTLERFNRDVAAWEHRVEISTQDHMQAKHLIKKMGGIVNFSIAIGKHPDWICYQMLGVSKAGKQSKSRQGLIYSPVLVMRLLKFARHLGVLLTPEDFWIDFMDDGLLKSPVTHPELEEWTRRMKPSIKQDQLEGQIAQLLED